jgi:very-short-patch-repair endonuclease
MGTIREFMAVRSGVVTRAELRTIGVTNERIAGLARSGAVLTIGRFLVALPGTRPEVLRAARLRAKVACVSAARARGLWAFDDRRFHVSIPAAHSPIRPDGRSPELRVHWTSRPLDLGDTAAVESGRNMLAHIAQCQPLDLAVATFDSAVNKGHISRGELDSLAAARGGRFAAVVAEVDGLADSGLESVTRVRLARRGIRARLQVVVDGHRVDLLVGKWLIIQCDGFEFHGDRAQRDRDLAQDNRFELSGHTVLRYGFTPIMFGWADVEREILGAVAQGLHLAPTWPRKFGRRKDRSA